MTGLIFEANLRPAKSQKVTELIKQVYKLSDSKPVTGLEVNYFPNAPQVISCILAMGVVRAGWRVSDWVSNRAI